MKRLALAALLFASLAYASTPRTGAGQLSTDATQIGNKDQRTALTVCNEDSTIAIRCSGSASTAFSNGIRVAAGNCWTVEEQHNGSNSAVADMYCASASGTPNYSYWETTR